MSTLFKLNWRDFVKGLALVLIFTGLTGAQKLLEANGLSLSLDSFSPLADELVKAAMSYLIKNLFSDSEGHLLGKL